MVSGYNYPRKDKISYSASNYQELRKIHEQLQGIEVKEEYINSVLHLRITTSFIPSSTNTKN